MVPEDRTCAPATAFLGLGSNLGDRRAHLQAALAGLGALPGTEITAVSSLYETAPVGDMDQPDFLNAVVAVRTRLAPQVLLAQMQRLEAQIGRKVTRHWGPRLIDIDLLLYGDRQVETDELIVPHPRLRERAFVLVPLAEIAPDVSIPPGKETVEAAAKKFLNPGNILPMQDVLKSTDILYSGTDGGGV